MQQPTSLEAIAGGHRDALIDAARVQVVVSFPAVTLSVGDANALRPGQVIDLGVSLAQARLTVSVSGEAVGEGRLMLVDQHAALLLLPSRRADVPA
jgi:flagellar motor switch/type III secretory pathway protein FliN